MKPEFEVRANKRMPERRSAILVEFNHRL